MALNNTDLWPLTSLKAHLARFTVICIEELIKSFNKKLKYFLICEHKVIGLWHKLRFEFFPRIKLKQTQLWPNLHNQSLGDSISASKSSTELWHYSLHYREVLYLALDSRGIRENEAGCLIQSFVSWEIIHTIYSRSEVESPKVSLWWWGQNWVRASFSSIGG